MRDRLASRFLFFVAFSTAACSTDLSGVFDSGSGNAGGAGQGGTTGTTTTRTDGGGGSGGATTSSTSGTTGSTSSTSGTTSSTTSQPCNSGPNEDLDKDGWTAALGDCNDCDPEVNPGAIEIPGNAADENCNGVLDDEIATCDDALMIDTQDAVQAVQAADLCKISGNTNDWGIIQAGWTMPDGAQPDAQQLMNFHPGHGILSDFGPNVPPRRGKKLLVLSSGTARRPMDNGYQSVQGFNKGYTSQPAAGLPKEQPACNGITSGQPSDSIAVSMLVRVPTNVHGFAFDFSFYAWDFPQFVCSQYNDVFFANVNPAPPGFNDTLVSYDELGSPISLNSADFRACGCMNGPPCTFNNKTYSCPLGPAPLIGTGFDQGGNGFTVHGATGWLTTTVAIEPGSQLSLRWGVYDAGDGIGDSTVLIDRWQWLTSAAVATKTEIAQ